MADITRNKLMADPKFHEGNRVGLEQLDRGQTVSYETLRRKYGGATEVIMAEQDKIEKVADAIHKMADEAEQSLLRDGYDASYPDKPLDRDFRRGYVRACRDNERALRE